MKIGKKLKKKLIQYLRVGIKKNHWYKVLNHEYFDEIGLRFNILDKAIYTENKLKSLEEVESIKTYLGNIIESVKFDVNYIF